jgi:hypothetical protein
MLAARNHRFRIAALLAAAAYLMLTARYSIEADHLRAEELVPGGYVVGAAVSVGVHLVGACGLVVIAVALGEEIDWRRLLSGGTIVAATLIAEFGAWVFRLTATLSHTYPGDYRAFQIWSTVGALLTAVGVGVIVSGFVESRRGTARASRLWVGMIVATASFLAATVAQLYLQSLYSGVGYAHELTIGTMVEAIGVLGTGLAALVFMLGARRPLGRREAALFAAAIGAAVAAVCIAAGEVLVGIAYTSHGASTWVGVEVWLGVAHRVTLVAALLCVALGARKATAP